MPAVIAIGACANHSQFAVQNAPVTQIAGCESGGGRLELERAARDSKLMRFTRGVTLEPDTVRDFAKDMNLSIGTSYEDVLADKSIDAVVLATPHTKHREQVEAAAAAGKHVFCEKPFALTIEDAKAALAACRKAGVVLGVGHNRRLWPSMVKQKELVSSPEFGT